MPDLCVILSGSFSSDHAESITGDGAGSSRRHQQIDSFQQAEQTRKQKKPFFSLQQENDCFSW